MDINAIDLFSLENSHVSIVVCGEQQTTSLIVPNNKSK